MSRKIGGSSAQVIRSIFPINGSPDFQIGTAQTVLGGMLMQFTGWVMVLAGVFVSYALIVQIQRAAETARVLSESTSSWAPVRIVLACIMMFPMPGGFSAGQAGVV